MKLSIVILLSLVMVVSCPNVASADPACDAVINAYKVELEAQKEVTEGERRLKEVYKKQRDDASDKADVGTSMPFYFWAVLGMAGGVILTRGIR